MTSIAQQNTHQSRLCQYGNAINSHDLVKVIAVITMIVDHVGMYLFPHELTFRAIGRMAAPLFFFLIGYTLQYRFKAKLLAYGLLLSSIYLQLSVKYQPIDILLNFILIRFIIPIANLANQSITNKIITFMLLFCLAYFIHIPVEYGIFGLLISLGGYLLAKQDPLAKAWIIASMLAYILDCHLTFPFHGVNFIMVIALSSINCLWMCHYSLKTYNTVTFCRPILLFISRYSLEIYVSHIIILIIAGLFFQNIISI